MKRQIAYLHGIQKKDGGIENLLKKSTPYFVKPCAIQI